MLIATLIAAAVTAQAPLQEDYPAIVRCVAAHLVVIEADKVPRAEAEPRIRNYVEVAHRIKPEGANFDQEVLDRKTFLQQSQAGLAAFNGGDALAGIRAEAAGCDTRWENG